MASISTRAPSGSAATWTVERAGKGATMYCGIDLVHGREVGHAGEEDGRLHDVLEAEAGGGEQLLQIFQTLAGLRADVAFDQLACLAIEMEPDRRSKRTDPVSIAREYGPTARRGAASIAFLVMICS